MLRHSFIGIFSTVCCLFVTGCASLPVSHPLPAGITSEPIISAVSPPFMVDAAGERLAYVRDGLWIGSVTTKAELRLSEISPVALAWSPDGTRLAAAFPAKDANLIRLFTPDGTKLGETELKGAVGDLTWRSAKELLIAHVVKSDYVFGSDYQQMLTSWDGSGQPTSVKVHNATLRLGTTKKLGTTYAQAFTLTVSPFGDEILFTRQHDPPEFKTYRRVMLRHLDSGREREITNIAQNSSTPLFIGSDDQLLVADGITINRVNPWQDASNVMLPVTGRALAASPGGTNLLIDGQLVHGDQIITRFPATVTGRFAVQGSQLFILHNGTIYQIKGLAADPVTIPSGDALKKLLTLRDWRMQGLITPADFEKTKPN
jgi:hypothetical protein